MKIKYERNEMFLILEIKVQKNSQSTLQILNNVFNPKKQASLEFGRQKMKIP